ncbi:MAG: RagB/SusD family nutrient uptake outer membrane protein [Bacteroidales bacterium]|nr:RagB/SusD family nutrient uptake outer membrane protein [Bacteroidales bacterium]
MFKKLNTIIIGIMAMIILSCSDFLEKNPLEAISSETFWKTEKDITMALTGVYSKLQCGTYNYARMVWDDLSGDAYPRSDVYKAGEILQGRVEPTMGGLVSQIFTNCYTGIAACNFFMDNIDKVPIDEELKNQYKGEVLFLRALHYFTLSEFYGGVPLYTKAPTIAESTIKQSTKEEVIDQVLADLEFAIAHLPNTLYSGHAVKGSALALKAKVLLHNEKWAEAADAANQVIQANIFSLYNNYPNLFLTIGQTNNPEIMFSTQYLLPDNYTNMSGYDINFGKECTLNPMQQFIDCFECIDGLPITSSPLYDPNNYKVNRDPRMDYTAKDWKEPIIRSDGYKYYNVEPSYTGYTVRKYLNPESVPWDYTTRDDQDQVLLRYADVLLMYAEAKNEATGPDLSVYNAINMVRGRESVNMPPIPSGLDKSAMRQRIRQERRVEFGLEGMRYLDLKRWKTIENILPSIINPITKIPFVFNSPKHYLFPFPQSEIDINPNLVQNPGY